jgi:spore germination protein YaaH
MKKDLQISLFFLVVFLSTQSIFPQEINKKGIHQLQKEEFGKIEVIESKSDAHIVKIAPLQKNKRMALSKIVFGFLPYWEYNSGAHNNIQYDLLTHLAAFDFSASSTGAITNPSNWPWTDVINASHNNGVKVIMAVTNFSGAEINTIITNTTSKNNLFDNIKNTITTYNLDGVNIDFEGLNNADEGSVINSFMSELTTFIHTELPGKEVSFDGPAVNWGNDWDLNGLAQSVDHLFILAYDYNGSWSSNTGAVAPYTYPSNGISVTKTLNNDYSQAISNFPDKIILGVPYYGKHWKTTTDAEESVVTSYIGSTFFRDDITNAASNGGYLWDSNSQTSWYKWNDGSDWNQIWCDNEQSIDDKYDLAISENLGGVGIWALNYDGARSELWDIIESKFGTTASIEDSFIKNNISIYPNPTNDFIKIANSKNIELTKISLFNTLGQTTIISNPKNKHIDISNLTNGIYFLKIADATGKQGTFKVLKSN